MTEHTHGHTHEQDHESHGHQEFTIEAGHWGAEFWDDRYGNADALWSGRANAALVTEVSELTPGRALDVGCGEGADVLWLASQGWQATGVDVSQVALDRAAGHARAAGPEIVGLTSWEQRDLLAWAPPAAAYDLVTVPFFHLPPAQRVPVYAALAAAVAPGGTLLVVAHSGLDYGVVPRPPSQELFIGADQLVADLGEGWDVVVAQDRPRSQPHPETGEPVTVHDTVVRARRLV